jgi:hypothetical protein
MRTREPLAHDRRAAAQHRVAGERVGLGHDVHERQEHEAADRQEPGLVPYRPLRAVLVVERTVVDADALLRLHRAVDAARQHAGARRRRGDDVALLELGGVDHVQDLLAVEVVHLRHDPVVVGLFVTARGEDQVHVLLRRGAAEVDLERRLHRQRVAERRVRDGRAASPRRPAAA